MRALTAVFVLAATVFSFPMAAVADTEAQCPQRSQLLAEIHQGRGDSFRSPYMWGHRSTSGSDSYVTGPAMAQIESLEIALIRSYGSRYAALSDSCHVDVVASGVIAASYGTEHGWSAFVSGYVSPSAMLAEKIHNIMEHVTHTMEVLAGPNARPRAPAAARRQMRELRTLAATIFAVYDASRDGTDEQGQPVRYVEVTDPHRAARDAQVASLRVATRESGCFSLDSYLSSTFDGQFARRMAQERLAEAVRPATDPAVLLVEAGQNSARVTAQLRDLRTRWSLLVDTHRLDRISISVFSNVASGLLVLIDAAIEAQAALDAESLGDITQTVALTNLVSSCAR